jgi:hypothetical protein
MRLMQVHKQRSSDKPVSSQIFDFSRYARPSEKIPYAYRPTFKGVWYAAVNFALLPL